LFLEYWSVHFYFFINFYYSQWSNGVEANLCRFFTVFFPYLLKPTISLISTKRTTTSHLKSLNTKTDHEIWNGKCRSLLRTDTKYGYLMHYYISILCSIFYSNKLVTYLLWSPKNTNNFFRRLWLIDIKSTMYLKYPIKIFWWEMQIIA
jgi:hypothetical protein